MRQKTIQNFLRLSSPLPQSEIELLAAHILRRSREFVIAHPEHILSRYQAYRLSQVIARRTRGTPLAYLTGRKEFFGLDFVVNKHVLIPRPETELLVELTIDRIRNNELGIRNKIIMIDVGTGNGCIPISIMKTLEYAFVTSSSRVELDVETGRGENMKTVSCYATDSSHLALRVAKQNCMRHNVSINFLHGNLLSPVINHSSFLIPHSSFIITANLPYLAESWYNAEHSIHHEPKLALVADRHNGLSLYKRLLEQISFLIYHFSFPITCFLEIDPRQSVAMQKLIHNLLPEAVITIHKDLVGHDRVIVIVMSNE